MTGPTEDTVDAASSRDSGGSVTETLASSEARQGAPSIARGATIGRYVVLSPLGAGAMGVVLAAYDPELDRKVALKLLKTRPGRDHETARARLLREAQALAKLNHSNVVAVHDVGIHGGQVFIAMEFVDGLTLGRWMRADGGVRPWREVVRVFEAAGRGLAAAHARGVIHRDFKPDNVMIGDDGRVRVMDFGLARSDDALGPSGESEPPNPHGDSTDEALTRTGALMGTPAYMSPEQFAGGEVTAASDQFGFCVALFEALYGERPFAGATITELALSVSEGTVIEPPRGSDVPRWLLAIVHRGLATGPERRFPDMPALLSKLALGETRRRRRRLAGAFGILGLGAAGVVGFRAWDESRRATACDDEGEVIASAWSPSAAAEVREALLATDLPYAATVADKTVPWLDRQASALTATATEACRRHSVERTWSSAIADRAQWCIEERRIEFGGVVAKLVAADTTTAERAIEIAAGLSAIEPCLDERTLTSAPAPPGPAERQEVVAVRHAIAAADALAWSGRTDEALELAEATTKRARSIERGPLLAAALVAEASLRDDAAQFEAAEALGEEAYWVASEGGAWGRAAHAASLMSHIVGRQQARHVAGRLWARHAAVALDHTGDPGELGEAFRLNQLGLVLEQAGELEEATAAYTREREIYEAALTPDHPSLGGAFNNLGNVAGTAGDYARARTMYERALEIFERAFGGDHPSTAMALGNLSDTLLELAEFEAARYTAARALAINESALGLEHPTTAATANNLGRVHEALGDMDRAEALYERALSIKEKAFAEPHPSTAETLGNLANVYQQTERLELAVSTYERALGIFESTIGADHPSVAIVLTNLGVVDETLSRPERAIGRYTRALEIVQAQLGDDHPLVGHISLNACSVQSTLGDTDQALAACERALNIYETQLGPDHPSTAEALRGLGKVFRQRGELTRSLEVLRRSLQALERSADVAPGDLALGRFELAGSLRASGDEDEAMTLARAALEGLGNDAENEERRAEIQAWLDAPSD